MYIPIRYQYRMKHPVSGLVHGIQINLLEDLDEFCTGKLAEQGVCRKDKQDPTMDYCRFQRRLIDVRPRSVYKASSLKCPNGYKVKLRFLEDCIRMGVNLNPFLSKLVKVLKAEDMMLYDWNMYHFHISNQMEKRSGFMERSDYLLIAYVTSEAVYFIDIVPHSEENKAHLWANKKYLQIIKENWPELIENYQLKDIRLSESVDEAAIYQLRGAGVTTFTELEDGTVYALIGGGYATDRSSTRAVMQADRLRRLTGDVEYVVTEQFWKMVQQSPELQRKIKENKPPFLKMIGNGSNKFTLMEPDLQILILVEVDSENTCWKFKMAEFQEAYRMFCHEENHSLYKRAGIVNRF